MQYIQCLIQNDHRMHVFVEWIAARVRSTRIHVGFCFPLPRPCLPVSLREWRVVLTVACLEYFHSGTMFWG